MSARHSRLSAQVLQGQANHPFQNKTRQNVRNAPKFVVSYTDLNHVKSVILIVMTSNCGTPFIKEWSSSRWLATIDEDKSVSWSV